jgi:hypothetical protein
MIHVNNREDFNKYLRNNFNETVSVGILLDEVDTLKTDLEWLTSKILEVMYAYSDETISRVNEIKENLK